jgi:hypothetical protein
MAAMDEDLDIDDIECNDDDDSESHVDEKILDLMHTVVKIEAPNWYMNPDFKLLYADEDCNNLNAVSDLCQIEYAETLPPVIACNKPPPFAFFTCLPAPIEDVWALYCVAMEKAG